MLCSSGPFPPAVSVVGEGHIPPAVSVVGSIRIRHGVGLLFVSHLSNLDSITSEPVPATTPLPSPGPFVFSDGFQVTLVLRVPGDLAEPGVWSS